ncbi:RAMP superfamily CRISPR-associated protein [Ruminococcus flavefaciens]|uniref:RAMP superfamily CRISPR-associated protein n=1 Tax=Ruminococcus flavefaciens TaxID=1265 RepID=UPI00046480B1|nr:RAMP superfamily CRISPR-associated protein [Ruminococcus flavefaciens]
MGKIFITLKSDLCSASGDGFSSIIDTDVCYDKYGFPYIGGRRLKGCLRAAAELIGSPYIDEIFGKSGSSNRGSLFISDARLPDIEELHAEAKCLDSENVLGLFTYIRASTAIENDTAKYNSLRFTRVIKHYSPFDGNELVFCANVEINKDYEPEFSDICKALRNIGYKRNRGYGAVKCEYVHGTGKAATAFESVSKDELEIRYTLRLDSNLMIPGQTSDETSDHILGTAMLGFLAGEYLKLYPADSEFEEIFLKNNVRFSNLIISDRAGTEYFPVPTIVGKIKGESGYFNILESGNEEERIIKPLKKGYCSTDLSVVSPLTETIYHHSTGKEGTLYTQTCLCSDQYFRGSISGKAEFIHKLYPLLVSGSIHIGRSKSAQYSSCSLHDISLNEAKRNEFVINPDKTFIVIAASDILLPDGEGGYNISVDAFKKSLGLESLKLDKDCKRKCSALRYRTIAGYNTMWNLKKPNARAIAAGSTLVFKAEKEMSLSEVMYIGAKQNEGFGKVMIIAADRFRKRSCSSISSELSESSNSGSLTELIEKNKKSESIRMKAIRFVENNIGLYSKKEVTPSQVGRWMMIVKQSDSYEELLKVVNSGKIDNFKEIVVKAGAEEYSGDSWPEYLLLILRLIKYAKRGE